MKTCRRLRADGVHTILMLTARGDVADRIEGLNVGADDYLTKPFAFGELIARFDALARRGEVERLPLLEVDDLRLDPVTIESGAASKRSSCRRRSSSCWQL